MTDIWGFIHNQILSMKWLNTIIGDSLSSIGVDTTSKIGGSLQFMIYDLIKIMILLTVLIFMISYIQSYFPPERTKRILGKVKGIKGNIAGALLGTVTPFCSCSSIPIFIGFTKAGLPLGTTFSFLISSPFVDLAAMILLMSVFGFETAIAYMIVGVILAIVGGMIIERLHMEDQIADFAKPDAIPVKTCSCGCSCRNDEEEHMTSKGRLSYSFDQVKSTVRKVFVYLLIGIGIGALIHNWIPADVIQAILGENNPFSVVIATLVGAPIYADIFGTIPIAEALQSKGLMVGTILSFMMAVTALSLPSLTMLKGVVKGRLFAVFVAILLMGIVIIGYTFNILQIV